MAEPYEDIDIETRQRIVGSFRVWAEKQPDRAEPVLRFLDGETLTPQDLLEESPDFLLEPRRPLEVPDERYSRSWAHVLNLVAVSVAQGESLEEILAVMRGERDYLY